MEKNQLHTLATAINDCASRYFQKNRSITQVKPGDLMPYLIKDRIFKKDHRNGLPLRNVLRELDKNRLLHLIPLLRVERKTKNRLWYFTVARHGS